MLQAGTLLTKVEVEVWATPREGMSLDELAQKMTGLGNTVLEVDRAGNRIKVLHTVDENEDA